MSRLALSVVLAVGMLFVSAPAQADETAPEPAETTVTAPKAEEAPAPAAEKVESEVAPAPEAEPEAAPEAVAPAPAAKSAAKSVVQAADPVPLTPGELCPTNYLKKEKMWEVSWGRQFSDTNGTTTFKMQSNGGLKFLNDGPVPSYMGNPATSSWRWLYVNDPVKTYSVKYGFADGTVRRANVSPDSQGCPSVEWTLTAPQPNIIETSHNTDVCGQVTVTLRNVSPWIYPVTVTKDGSDPRVLPTNPPTNTTQYGPVVDNRTRGKLDGPQKDVTKSATYSFAEDSGPQVLKYVVAAGTENKLYKGKDVGEVTTVKVNTDCIPPQPEPIVTSESTDTVQCDLNRVETSTVTTTINFSLVDKEWVQDDPIVSDPVITYRDSTDEECPPQPDPIVTSESTDTVQCDVNRVEVSTVTTTINYSLVNNKWVQDDPIVSDPVITTRDATEAECPTAVESGTASGEVKSGQVNANVSNTGASPTSDGLLPNTGGPLTIFAVIGVLLVAAGGLLVRKRAAPVAAHRGSAG